MTEVEQYVVDHINDKKFKFPAEFNPATEYSDEFYEKIKEIFIKYPKFKHAYRTFKRILDFIIALILIIILIPLYLIIIIAIKIDSKGPAIFKQDRMGKYFKPFKCWKFRTMSMSAPHDEATSLLKDSESYVTKVGKFLRKTSLDELAQIFNVLTNKMSFIGYRPIILTEKKLNDFRNELGVYDMKPGITGFTQIHGRDDVYYKNKAIMDAYYVKRSSLWFDIKILFGSVGVVLFRKGNKDDNKQN